MKGNKYKIIVSTLILLFLCAVPAYALSLTCKSQFTSTGISNPYIGGLSYTTGSGYDSYEIDSYLFQDGSIVDEDHDSDSSWAQGDIGCNNPTGYQNWTIRGYHIGWIQENDITNTTREIYNE